MGGSEQAGGRSHGGSQPTTAAAAFEPIFAQHPPLGDLLAPRWADAGREAWRRLGGGRPCCCPAALVDISALPARRVAPARVRWTVASMVRAFGAACKLTTEHGRAAAAGMELKNGLGAAPAR